MLIIFSLIWQFLSLFVRKVENNVVLDGLGRELQETPYILQLLWGDFPYKGFLWLIIDVLIFIGVITLGGYIYAKSVEDNY